MQDTEVLKGVAVNDSGRRGERAAVGRCRQQRMDIGVCMCVCVCVCVCARARVSTPTLHIIIKSSVGMSVKSMPKRAALSK